MNECLFELCCMKRIRFGMALELVCQLELLCSSECHVASFVGATLYIDTCSSVGVVTSHPSNIKTQTPIGLLLIHLK
jgi:hypothetical protein